MPAETRAARSGPGCACVTHRSSSTSMHSCPGSSLDLPVERLCNSLTLLGSRAGHTGTQCAAGEAPVQGDPPFVVDFGPPAILKARRGCVLHTIKLYQEIAA